MFAERLKEARKAKRYSQAEVSRMLGVTQQAVGKWETGRSTPDPQTVARLAEILDTPTDVLLGLRKESGAASAVGRNAFSRYTESQIPVVGTVRAGYGALAFEEDYGKEYACVKDPENYFFLVVKGDSMEPRISGACAPPEHAGQRRSRRSGLRGRRRGHAEKVHPARQLGHPAPLQPGL